MPRAIQIVHDKKCDEYSVANVLYRDEELTDWYAFTTLFIFESKEQYEMFQTAFEFEVLETCNDDEEEEE